MQEGDEAVNVNDDDDDDLNYEIIHTRRMLQVCSRNTPLFWYILGTAAMLGWRTS